MNKLTIIGRVLFAVPFAIFGLNHIFLYDWYLGNFTSFLPLGPFTIIMTGLLMIIASISIITKKYVKLTTQTLAGLLLVFIVSIHVPHLFEDGDKTMTLITLLKDISLMGGSLMIAGMCSNENDESQTKAS